MWVVLEPGLTAIVIEVSLQHSSNMIEKLLVHAIRKYIWSLDRIHTNFFIHFYRTLPVDLFQSRIAVVLLHIYTADETSLPEGVKIGIWFMVKVNQMFLMDNMKWMSVVGNNSSNSADVRNEENKYKPKILDSLEY